MQVSPLQRASLKSGSHAPFSEHVDELDPVRTKSIGQVSVIDVPSIGILLL